MKHYPALRGTASALCATLLLSACTIIPGSHIAQPASNWFDEIKKPTVKTDIDYINIDAALVSQSKVEKSGPANYVSAPEWAKNQDYEYRIGAGDVLEITIWEHPASFQTSVQTGGRIPSTEVHADGTIYYPYAGTFKVEGFTTNQVRKTLAKKLSRVLESPRLDVNVASYRSQKVFVSGEVLKPGVIPVTSTPLTLLQAVQQAGGFAPTANPREVLVTRGDTSQKLDMLAALRQGDWSVNRQLEHGDVVYIPRNDNLRVSVMGEVRIPKSVLIGWDDISLAQALIEAGGINERNADAKGVFVLRDIEQYDDNGEPGYRSKAFRLNAASATAYVLAEKFKLQPGDVVYVTAAPVARWNRLVSAVLPSLLAAENAQDIQNN